MNTKNKQSVKTQKINEATKFVTRNHKANASNIAKLTPTGGRGANVSANTKITLGLDAEADFNAMPKQVQLVLIYLSQLGGTATIGQLIEVADKEPKGANYWGTSDGQPYEQDVRKIVAHYSAKMLGNRAWSKRVGNAEVIRITS
tara:strand:+ start:133 stop:567 length:435 start_codon:yes stop_codon:yes gene_type:complete